MAIATNTTKTVNKPSLLYKDKIEDTKKNMKKKMAKLGIAEPKTVRTLIPSLMGSKDDVVFCSINGEKFYFKRGESYDMPEPIAELLKNTHQI